MCSTSTLYPRRLVLNGVHASPWLWLWLAQVAVCRRKFHWCSISSGHDRYDEMGRLLVLVIWFIPPLPWLDKLNRHAI
ncbi:hypothetical protein F4680DRAFT_417582 [Xylaria scruposa]|nr:hypothetical protein F4680DRAFT_417582 [Xylaria scruposa]